MADVAARTIAQLEQSAWGLAALAHLAASAALTDTALITSSLDDDAAARILVALGLASTDSTRYRLVPGWRACSRPRLSPPGSP